MQKCCLKKEEELNDQFSKNNIISKGEKFYDVPKKSEESILEKPKQNLINQFLTGCEKLVKSNAVKAYNNLVNKPEQMAELRSATYRQKMLKIFNYLGEISNGPTGLESVSQGEGYKY